MKINLVICIDYANFMEITSSTTSKEEANQDYEIQSYNTKWMIVYLVEDLDLEVTECGTQ